MRHQIRKRLRDFISIIVLAVIAAVVGGYILNHERLRFPVIQKSTFKLKAELSTAQAVTPGQGQTVRVSGVRIGDLSKVELKDGLAIVTMALDPEYKKLVHTDASALLRPKTGLKDMFIELNPGSASAPVAKENWTIPVARTKPDINPDEVYAALDADTRDYLKLLVNGAGRGLDRRGGDLAEVFRRFEPLHRDIARANELVVQRRHNLRRLINSLQRLNGELATKDDELAQLVDSSAAVFRAFASEDRNISRAVADFPGALRQTTDTLEKVQRFAEVLAPTADKLRPAVRALDDANHAIQPFMREAAPIVRKRIRPFIQDARPVLRDLRPATKRLAKATPDLTGVFTAFNHLFNMAGYNPGGRESADKATRQEGYLFWLAWLSHDGANLFSITDAHGPFRPVTLGATCNVFKATVAENPPFEFLANLSPILGNPALCPP